MLTQITNGRILTPQGWVKDSSVLISDGHILEVTNSELAVIGAEVVDAKGYMKGVEGIYRSLWHAFCAKGDRWAMKKSSKKQ